MSEKPDALAAPVGVTMRRPTLSGVPSMPIPAAPRVVRRARVEEAGALAALLGRAYPTETREAWERVLGLLSGESSHGR